MPAKTKKSGGKKLEWNLGLLYKSDNDPQIESDMGEIERLLREFAVKYDTNEKKYLTDESALLEALGDWKRLAAIDEKPLYYFQYLADIDAKNPVAPSRIAIFSERLAKAGNETAFFKNSLGAIAKADQERFLKSPVLKEFKVFLKRAFDDARHQLSVPEEKILNLKSQPAYDMWVSGNERILNKHSITWKGKEISLAAGQGIISSSPKAAERGAVTKLIYAKLKAVAPFSEAELNAIVTNKKINDELRGYRTPYEDTVRAYRNEPIVIETLVRTVTEGFPIAQRYYRLKAKLLGMKRLAYSDRVAKLGNVKASFSFEKSLKILSDTFGRLSVNYADILHSYAREGQIDVLPRLGKTGGAYCSGSYSLPTFVLLNHTDTLDSFRTFAHEMGHAFHTELSKKQGPFYSHYSMSLAETASTLFEAIALDTIFDSLSEAEQIAALEKDLNASISTIFRQIACFNFEKDLHETIRAKGYLEADAIADIHNRNMQAYLGPIFKMTRDDGYMFVSWSHIRRFFYVYSYAYGMLVSKALLRRYRQDKSFWKKIEEFLSAGGSDSPENILKKIGIDVSKPDFWKEGLKEIEDDIDRLERLTMKKSKASKKA